MKHSSSLTNNSVTLTDQMFELSHILHHISPPYKAKKATYELKHFKNSHEILIKMSLSMYGRDSCNIMWSTNHRFKKLVLGAVNFMFKTKIVSFASFICLFGQTTTIEKRCVHGSVRLYFI